MPECSHIYCKPSPSQAPYITYHRFPLTNPTLTKKWTTAMQRSEWEPSPNDYLCSLHFDEFQFFIHYKKKYLKPHAVPTIFQLPSNGKLPLPKLQSFSQEKRGVAPSPVTSIKPEFVANKDHATKRLIAKPIQPNGLPVRETNFPSLIRGNGILNEIPQVQPFSMVQLPRENNVNMVPQLRPLNVITSMPENNVNMVSQLRPLNVVTSVPENNVNMVSQLRPLNVVTSVPENNVNMVSQLRPLNVVTSVPENNVNMMPQIRPLNVVTSMPGNVLFSRVPQLSFIQPVQNLLLTPSVPVQSSFKHNLFSLRPILPKPILLCCDSPNAVDRKDQTNVIDSIIPHLSDEISITKIVEQNPEKKLHKESTILPNQKVKTDLSEQHVKKPVFSTSASEKDHQNGNENMDQPVVNQNSSIKIKALKTIGDLNKLKRRKMRLKTAKQKKKFFHTSASRHKGRSRISKNRISKGINRTQSSVCDINMVAFEETISNSSEPNEEEPTVIEINLKHERIPSLMLRRKAPEKEKKIPFDHEYSLPSQVNLKQRCEYLMMVLRDTFTELKYTRQKLGSRQMKILQQKACIINLKEELYRKKKNSRNNYHMDPILDPDLILSGKLFPEIEVFPVVPEK